MRFPKIAFLTPNYLAPSETWIWRQVKYLNPYLAFIGVQQKVNQDVYEGVPLLDINQQIDLISRIYARIIRKKEASYTIYLNIKRIEKNYPFDIFYIHYLTQAYQLKKILLETDKKILIHCHGYDVTWDMKRLQFPFSDRYSEDYLNFALDIQKKAIFIANSNNTKRKIMSTGIDEDRIRVLKFGVNTDIKLRPKKEKKIKILFLGRLVDFKGPHNTIFAFEKVCEMGLSADLIIAGDGPLMSTCRLLRNRSRYKKRIKIIGPVSSVKAEKLRSECHIFTAHNMKGELTNQVEAYGVSIIEAMAAGLPVVTGKSGGITETVLNGKTGILFSPGDVGEHAAALFKLGKDRELRKKMGAFCIEYAKKEFSDENEKNNLFKIFNSLKFNT